uniref:Cilia- and flagella-associated protein 52 n=1 Tax=Tetraodon nigroviridis TaxID=99883 RepID=H3CIU6_TETNG
MQADAHGVASVELRSVFGFNDPGRVCSGLRLHPDRERLLYPLGSALILRTIKDGQQELLQGHTNDVSCLSVSRSGSYVASGQVDCVGFKAAIIIWDYAQRGIYAQLLLHEAKVEAVDFSPDEKYLVSLGGQDDGRVVVWNVASRQAICGSPASGRSSSSCLTVQFCNTNSNLFVTAGSSALRVWELDPQNKKMEPTECRTGILKRVVTCIEISEDDQFLFCGTTSGDILKINLRTRLLSDYGPKRSSAKHGRSVSALRMLRSGHLLVGSGCGKLMLCSATGFQALKEAQLEKAVTSIALSGEDQRFFVGTEAAQMYSISCQDFRPELVSSSHRSGVKDVAICFGTSELFATCSEEDIRLWHIDKPKELLRITVPNMTCNALDFMTDGHSIISAWDDGKIRVFAPESGRLMLIIHGAHNMGVTAIAGTRNCKRIISGGGTGMVRVWELQSKGHRLLETMKEHKGTVTCVKIKGDDKECVSASSDGVCIIWDIVRFVSLKMVITNRLFRAVCYHPDIYQIITSGTDRKVVYWDAYDGSAIRELEGLLAGSITAMDISPSGSHFVTGGDDNLVRVWDYMEGVVTHVGTAHGGSITSIKLCSNSSTLISTSADGAIVLWRFPHSPT